MDQRYRGTYGFLKNGAGKKLLVEILNVDARFTQVQDTKGNQFTLASDTGCELEFTQVPMQWFQPDPDHIAYVYRRAERQYKRGICAANTNIMVPRKNGYLLTNVDTSAAKIEALFNPEDGQSAFKDINKIKCGLWSKFFAWAEGYVYVKDMLIGTVDHETKIITLEDGMFVQEMRDALNRSNSTYVVKVEDA